MAPMVTPGDPQAAPRSGAWIDGMVQHQTGVLRISAFGFGFDIGVPGLGQWLKDWYNNGPLNLRGRRQPLACLRAALCRNRSHSAPWLQLQLGPQPQPQPQVQRGSFRAVGAEAQQQPRRATVATDWCGVMGFSLVWGGSGGSEWGKARCHQLAASCRLESPGVLCTGFRWPPSPAAAANCHSQVPQPSPTANCRCQLPQRTAAADRRCPGPDSRLSPGTERLRSDRPGAWIHPVRRHFKARGPMPWKRSQPGCA